ncbi:MAG: YcgL domain-containing protein [Xanthomonadales bacterium]|nr:YcgL domain-containing protein [Xanthomonadaceae bacterium]MBN8224752.1 YcgL domain-containing protein [Xanthomonadales bacterium]MCA0197134.1 YcgL domain-containing protein [Pseudomonadota bacterium]
MQAFVYKSRRRADTYVFLAARDDFARLPEPLRARLGELSFVLEVELTPDRRLAQSAPETVRANLAARGFHLQLPPAEAATDAQDAEPVDG